MRIKLEPLVMVSEDGCTVASAAVAEIGSISWELVAEAAVDDNNGILSPAATFKWLTIDLRLSGG